jgi:hypothetical protein
LTVERHVVGARLAQASLTPSKGAPKTRPRGRQALALLALVAAVASLALYAQDRRIRGSAEGFARSMGLDRSLPEEMEAMALEPAGDLAMAMVVTAGVSRQSQTVSSAALPGNATQELRWNVASIEGLRAAQGLVLDAVAARPGWPDHRYLLGLVDFEQARRSADCSAGTGRWSRTLRLATSAASGSDAAWMALGEADLECWAQLLPADRSQAPQVFRRCLLSESFVSSRFRDVVAAIGSSQAIGLLPEDAGALQAAARTLAEDGDVRGASHLLSRTDEAERKERAADLRRLEDRRRLGDIAGLRLKCRSWFDQHSYRQFDDATGRAEVARLLELWPDDRYGPWAKDPRARLVRFFLEGRVSEARGKTLLKTLDSLTGVPEPVRARISLLAGDVSGAQALVNEVGADPLEWAPYFLELARQELAKGRIKEARAALESLSPGAREECEALLVRRQLARAHEDKKELAAVEARLELLRRPSSEDWTSRGAVSLCVDPESSSGKLLEVRVGEGAAAIFSYGWDGGRLATLSVPGEASVFRVSLAGLSGRHSLWVSFLVGGQARTLRASIEGGS